TSISATAARGSASSADRSCCRETPIVRTRPTAWMSAIRPPPGSSTSISPISSPGPIVNDRPGRSTRASFEHEQQIAALLPHLHDRLTVRVLALDSERQDRIEQLAREEGEDLRI